MIRVLIADDHPVFRHGLATILADGKEFEVVGEASEGSSALAMMEQLAPDIAVLDIAMPGMSGLDVVRTANERNIEVEFVILTMYNDEVYFHSAMELGVKGYVLKESALHDLLACLRAVADGRFYVSPLVSHYLVKRNEELKTLYTAQPSLRELTPTEKKILRLIAENRTSREIGKLLHISYRTVQNHRTNICQKLNLQGYNRLLQFALENRSSL
jgi:DNA-binding NarL/FixJ family response regulator